MKRPAALSEDDVWRWRQHTLDLHDEVVQGLALAKLSFELGESDTGLAAIDRTLDAAHALVSDLLGEAGGLDLGHGALRRATPAGP